MLVHVMTVDIILSFTSNRFLINNIIYYNSLNVNLLFIVFCRI